MLRTSTCIDGGMIPVKLESKRVKSPKLIGALPAEFVNALQDCSDRPSRDVGALFSAFLVREAGAPCRLLRPR